MQPDGTYRLGATTNYLNLLILSFVMDIASLSAGKRLKSKLGSGEIYFAGAVTRAGSTPT